MSLDLGLDLGLGLGLQRGGGDPLAIGRVLDLGMTTGQDYSALSVTSTSAGTTTGPLVPVYAGDSGTPGVSNRAYMPKPAGMLVGWDGVRLIRNYTPAPNSAASWTSYSGATKTNQPDGSIEVGITATGLSGIYIATPGPISKDAVMSVEIKLGTFSGTIHIGNAATSTTYLVIPNAQLSPTEWRRFAVKAVGPVVWTGIWVRAPSPNAIAGTIFIRNAQIEDGIDAISIPSMYIDSSASAGWIADPVTGERAYGLGSGVALSWTKPGGSIDGNGVFTPALGAAIPDVKWRGPLPAATNLCLYSRDLTNATWTKTDATAAKTATGIDGSANSASTLTATAGNATCLQSITSGSSERRQSAFVKRRTGSGVVEVTQDGGTTWTSVPVTANWTRVDIPSQTLANPGVGFRIVTSGDAIDIDMAQQEVGATVTPPIATTAATVTRLAETVSDTVAAMGADWTVAATLDYSAGLPSAEQDILVSGADKISITTAGKLKVTDGTNNTTSTAGLSAAAGQKIGISRSAGASILQIGATQEAGAAVDWTGDTVLTLGGPIQKLKIWPARALSAGDLSNA